MVPKLVPHGKSRSAEDDKFTPISLSVWSGITARFDGVIGAEAALLLLEEMKILPSASGVSPDIFTYTTVISGIARAEVSPD